MDNIIELLNEVTEYPLELRLAVALHDRGENDVTFWRRYSAGEFVHISAATVHNVHNHLRDIQTGWRKVDSTLLALGQNRYAQRIEKFKAKVLDPNNLYGITDKYEYAITINELEVVE